MKQLKASLFLKEIIEKTNAQFSLNTFMDLNKANNIYYVNHEEQLVSIKMNEFSNEFVMSFLHKNKGQKAFVITDVASMDVKGKRITYLLYKGYHQDLEKGMVFYQLVNPDSLELISDLQYSNSEDNIFYDLNKPDGEGSSCNAMETANHSNTNPEIAFLIGHMNEERLAYDIESLIVETAFNVLKNPKLYYNFIVQISLYGNMATDGLRKKVKEIEDTTKTLIEPAFNNSSFSFVWE